MPTQQINMHFVANRHEGTANEMMDRRSGRPNLIAIWSFVSV